MLATATRRQFQRRTIRKDIQLSSFSTSKKSSLEKQKILSKTLYRQILRWSRTFQNIPFDPMPPLTLMPPRIDATALQTFASIHENESSVKDEKDKHLLHLTKSLPRNTIIEENKLVIPIHNAADVKNATRTAYALNNYTNDSQTDLDELKHRVSLGLEVLKSLNQLGGVLEPRKESRQAHLNRNGVQFGIGGVVQHKTKRWRGVVAGWKKVEVTSSKSDKTSLTNKNYDLEKNIDGDDDADTQFTVEYTIHVDEGDAAHTRTRVLGSVVAMQNELEEVSDNDLKRIRNSLIKRQFEKFDPIKTAFIPGDLLQYEYPKDVEDYSTEQLQIESMDMIEKHDNAKKIITACRQIASELHQILRNVSSCLETRKMDILAEFEKKLSQIISGKFDQNFADQITKDVSEESSHKIAMKHLHELLNISTEINSMLWQHNTAKKNADRIKFQLGSVVKHKKYGFRGVIIAWDPYPKTDVSQWDGLQDIEGDVNSMPFYHVIPDLEDTRQAFGAERPFRYVCQENLELCPEIEQDIEVTLEEGWSNSEGKNEFVPPASLKFCHAEINGEDDEIVATTLGEMQSTFNKLLISVRERDSYDDGLRLDINVHDLFDLLKYTECLEDAFVAEEAIKETWKAHKDKNVRLSLDDGIADLLRGDKASALSIYEKIIEEDPEYLEAHNKKATCHYMLGEMQKSIEAAKKVIDLNPLHSQAHAGLGLVYSDLNNHKMAAKSFRRCLQLNPWSPVSSRLNHCLDVMKKLEINEEDELSERELSH